MIFNGAGRQDREAAPPPLIDPPTKFRRRQGKPLVATGPWTISCAAISGSKSAGSEQGWSVRPEFAAAMRELRASTMAGCMSARLTRPLFLRSIPAIRAGFAGYPRRNRSGSFGRMQPVRRGPACCRPTANAIPHTFGRILATCRQLHDPRNALRKGSYSAGTAYSTPRELSSIGRSILSSTLLSPALTRRWLKPVARTADPNLSLGSPFEILTFTDKMFVARYLDPDTNNRYGTLVYVRCTAGKSKAT